MDSEEQEAKSNIQGNKTALILRLRSGRVAIFNRAFEYIDTVDADTTLDEILPDYKPQSQSKRPKL